MARRPPKAHHLVDWEDGAAGIVRCAEGDSGTFMDLATELVAKHYPNWTVRPVAKWAWWKVNPVHPDWGCDFRWSLSQVDGPGAGRWQGALIYLDHIDGDWQPSAR